MLLVSNQIETDFCHPSNATRSAHDRVGFRSSSIASRCAPPHWSARTMVGQLYYVDFIPKLLQAETPFSTLSLTGDVPGPRYEDFDGLVRKANDWVHRHGDVKLLNCEVLELDGTYQVLREDVVQDPDSSPKKKGIPAFLRIIRLWYRQLDDADPPRTPTKQRVVLDYINILPARLESTPRAFGPKFQTLAEMIQSLNKKLLDDPTNIEGEVLSIQTSVCRFSSKHCGIDPDRTFWMASTPDDMHICYFFRLFVLRTGKPAPTYQIGFKDFPPKCDWKTKKRKHEDFKAMTDRAHDWLATSAGVKVVNCQTVDHHSYLRCARDTPGHEAKALNNPHFRSTYWGLMDYAKVLRIFHCSSLSNENVPEPRDDRQSCTSVFQKTFHVLPCISTDHVILGRDYEQTNLCLPLSHSRVVDRVNEWLQQAGAELITVETVKVTTNLKTTLSAEECIFEAAHRGSNSMLFGIRIFFQTSSNHKPLDLSPEPKTVKLGEDSCVLV